MNKLERMVASRDELIASLLSEKGSVEKQLTDATADRDCAAKLLEAAKYVRDNDGEERGEYSNSDRYCEPDKRFIEAAKLLADEWLKDGCR